MTDQATKSFEMVRIWKAERALPVAHRPNITDYFLLFFKFHISVQNYESFENIFELVDIVLKTILSA